jgi:hypothetical protein
MKVDFFLIVNENGTVKTVKNRPSLKYNEVSIAMTLELPWALFQKPQLTASIVVPSDRVAPFQIEADTMNNVREAIEVATGLNVRLSFAEQEGGGQ